MCAMLADVMRIRRERNRLALERKARKKEIERVEERPGLEDRVRRVTSLRERPGDQRVLPWARFPQGNTKA